MTTSRPSRVPGVLEPVLVPYGGHPDQHAVLHLPAHGDELPVVVIVHGGFWGSSYGAELGTPLAVDLAGVGLAAWNLEYRRVGGGGGWPTTFTDVATGVDALASAAQQTAARRAGGVRARHRRRYRAFTAE